MLVITRKPGESTYLVDADSDETIGEVKIIELNLGQNYVRIGFEFPRSIKILRDNIKDIRTTNDSDINDEPNGNR